MRLISHGSVPVLSNIKQGEEDVRRDCARGEVCTRFMLE
jgi:hypothetical protein